MPGDAALIRELQHRIEKIDSGLSRLLHQTKAGLHPVTPASDNLLVCGLLGGKDAGKSTLINRLAGKEISVDREPVGEGTVVPIAYVHRAEVETLRRRPLTNGNTIVDWQLYEHDRDNIRNLVIVDLPDIDSTFSEHLEVVNSVIPQLDRVVWMTTPSKGADLEMARLLKEVIRDTSNIYCVQNKCDMLLNDGIDRDNANSLVAIWREQFDETLCSLGLRDDRERQFLLAAKHADSNSFTESVREMWGSEYSPANLITVARSIGEVTVSEADRLKRAILAPISDAEVLRKKSKNVICQFGHDLNQIEVHYQPAEKNDEAVGLLSDLEKSWSENFGDDYVSRMASRFVRAAKNDDELARELLGRRVNNLPILHTMYWALGLVGTLFRPLRPIMQLLKRFGGATDVPVRNMNYEGTPRVGGSTFETGAMNFMRQLEHAPEWLRAGSVMRKHVCRESLDELRKHVGDQIVEMCAVRNKTAARWKKAALWLPLIWFTLMQPILQGFLQLGVGWGVLGRARGLLIIVESLGAVSLIRGLAVSLVLYLVILATMYSRAVRDISTMRRGSNEMLSGQIGHILDHEIRQPIVGPIQQMKSELDNWRGELEETRRQLNHLRESSNHAL